MTELSPPRDWQILTAVRIAPATQLSTGDLSVTGALSVTGQFLAKPWVAFLVTTDTNGLATISNHVGQKTTGISLVGRTTTNPYNFTIPAHPNGTNYQVILSPYSTSSGTSTAWPTGYAQTSTSIWVYCRSGIGVTTTVNGSFYVHTVP